MSQVNPLVMMSLCWINEEMVPWTHHMIHYQLFQCGGFGRVKHLFQWGVGRWEGWQTLSVPDAHFALRSMEVLVDHWG